MSIPYSGVHTLFCPRSDQELLEYALETLQILFEASSRESGPDDLGVQFSEIFLKSADNINLLLACLEVSHIEKGVNYTKSVKIIYHKVNHVYTYVHTHIVGEWVMIVTTVWSC